jgi:hypothetical protein
VNLTDGVSDIVPTSVGLTGNDLDIVIPTPIVPSGVEFKFPIYWQRTSYRTGDIGDRVQTGWMNDLVNPPNPKSVANLDYTSLNWWQTLKNPLIVGGISNTLRFVDVDGGQTFSATNNKNLVTIDKLTSLMYTRGAFDSGSNWNGAIDNALSYSIVVNGITYDDWYLASAEEYLSIFGYYRTLTGGLYNDVSTLLVGAGNNNHWTSTTVETATIDANTYGTTSKQLFSLNKTVGLQRYIFVRKAINLITAP